MEQRAFALGPGSLGGGAISEKSLVSVSDVVISALEPLRLCDEPLLDDGSGGSCSFWYSCSEPERGSVASLAVLDDGSSSRNKYKNES